MESPAEEQAERFIPSAFSLPQPIVDMALRFGANGRNSLQRIVAHFLHNHGVSADAAFLRDLCGNDGVGLRIDGRPYAVWYDENGIRLAHGSTVHRTISQLLPWEQAAQRIRELLNEGSYTSQAIVDEAPEHELREIADRLWTLESNADYDVVIWDRSWFSGGHPESMQRISAALKEPEQLETFVAVLRPFMERYTQDRELLRFHSLHPQQVLSRLLALQEPSVTFPAQALPERQIERFLTDDEIDAVFGRGGVFEGSKFRVYRTFTEPHSSKEKQETLKEEFGTGGHYGDGTSLDYSPKGIQLKRPHAEPVKLNWNQAAKRVERLIAAERYLSDKERQEYPGWLEAEKVKEAERAERAAKRAADWLDEIDVEAIRKRLQEPGRAEDMLEQALRIAAEDPANGVDLEREIAQLRADDSAFPDGVKATGDITVTREGDTVTLDSPNSTGDYVEIDVELALPVPQIQQTQPTPDVERVNYKITDDHLGEGGAKTKYQRNVAAIRLLKELDKDKRLATADEQAVLAQYVGWGGIPQAFDRGNTDWEKESAELAGLLTSEEYAAARASTLNAHYTSPVVVRAIYQALERMGFHGGSILEPACGTGHFFGMLPESMAGNTTLCGVELDPITGRIARQLYQKADIRVQGFEATAFPDNHFDVAIGNVPFGNYRLADARYDRHSFLIHDYFFAKALDKVRPGGIVAFITSKGTLDKDTPEVRRYLAERADLLGAIRLPSTAFKANAGTEVTADILFLQKRERIIEAPEDWLHKGYTDTYIPINEYFVAHTCSITGWKRKGWNTLTPGRPHLVRPRRSLSWLPRGRVTGRRRDSPGSSICRSSWPCSAKSRTFRLRTC